MTRDRWRRGWYCVAMGGVVHPLLFALQVGRWYLMPVLACVTVVPWLCLVLVERRVSWIAAVALTWFVVVNAVALAGNDGSGRAIGWVVVTWNTYVAVGVAALVGLVVSRRARVQR